MHLANKLPLSPSFTDLPACCVHLFLSDRLLAIAEETLAEFLSKATGTAVDWVQMLGMKVRIEALIHF